jgi:hypothetical protein
MENAIPPGLMLPENPALSGLGKIIDLLAQALQPGLTNVALSELIKIC